MLIQFVHECLLESLEEFDESLHRNRISFLQMIEDIHDAYKSLKKENLICARCNHSTKCIKRLSLIYIETRQISLNRFPQNIDIISSLIEDQSIDIQWNRCKVEESSCSSRPELF